MSRKKNNFKSRSNLLFVEILIQSGLGKVIIKNKIKNKLIQPGEIGSSDKIIIKIMASLKDKLKSKIKARNEPETMESFDQTSLTLTLLQGKSQISQMKVQCTWTSKNNLKVPRLKCRWYNRSDNNYQEIVGIEEEIYQPSILDIDSTIEVTCIPELPGVNYEGMPILLKSNKIVLATETQMEANRLLQNGKCRLFVNIRSARLKNIAIAPGSEGILLVQKGKIAISETKFGQLNDYLLKSIDIDQSYPQMTINRKVPKQIQLKFNEEQSCVIQFKSHQIRDYFYLYHKILMAKMSIDKQQKLQIKTEESVSHIQNQNQQQSVKKENPNRSEQTFEIKLEIDNSKNKKDKIMQSPVKQNASDLLQLVKLKQEIKRLQLEGIKLTKDLDNEKNKNQNLEIKISQLNQRLDNASKNYFLIEQELNSSQQRINFLQKELQDFKKIQSSKDEEIIYYKNEIKMVMDQSNNRQQELASLQLTHKKTVEQLSFYKEKYDSKDSISSYKEIFDQLNIYKEVNKQLKLKYDYGVEIREKMEENLKNSRNLIEQIQSEKRYLQKKYESLTNELSSPNLSPSLSSKISERSQGSLSNSFIVEELPHLDKRDSFGKAISCETQFRQKQILELKKQIKILVQEINYLRTLLSKQKKSSSKTALKLQLFDAKKIVTRLSQAIAEKQMTINQLKEINKDLNRKNQILIEQNQHLAHPIKH